MSEQQQTPLTYERILELFRQTDLRLAQQFQETDRKFQEKMDRMSLEARLRSQELDRKFQETDRKFQETDRKIQETAEQMKKTDRIVQKTAEQIKRTSKEVSSLSTSVGQIVENMVGGDIVGQFRELGYAVVRISRNVEFGEEGTSASGEIDLLLEDGDVAILIEAKTKPGVSDILRHIERLEKFRSHVNRDGNVEKRQFIGAIAGASIKSDVIKFAHRKGMYVIVQTGRIVEIIATPEGFQARKW